MALLNDKLKQEIKEVFKDLKADVTIKYFTQEMECHFCKETHELYQELKSLSDKIRLEVYDFIRDEEQKKRFAIDKIPGAVIMADKDFGIRFFGIPSGYEFSSLIEAVKMVSTGETRLTDATRDFLRQLDKDVHLQVFVTPTCPYCPPAVVLAQQMALVSPRVRADMIEATEFPQLSQKFNVMGVPRTVINGREFIEGAAPEKMLVDKIKESLKAG